MRKNGNETEDRRELARGLFVAATELLEAAHGVATNGQSGRLTVEDYRVCSETLSAAIADVAILAKAVTVLCATSDRLRDGR